MNYLIQINLYLFLFYAFYWLLLRNETFYQLNRIYLVAAGLLSFFVPFWHSEWVQSWLLTQQVNEVIYTISLDEIVVQSASENRISFTEILAVLYWVGVGVLFLRFVFRLLRTLYFIYQNEHIVSNAFSFFGFVKINECLDNKQTIETHEQVHSRQLHSVDVILFELIAVVCWFNPVVYLYKKAIVLLHEFIADEQASQTLASKADYAVLLVSQQFQTTPDLLLSHSFFNQSILKRRIHMLMKKRSNKTAIVKYGFTAPLFIGMMVVASASIAKSEKLAEITHLEDVILSQIVAAPTLTKHIESKPDTTQKVVVKNEEVFEQVDENPEYPGGFEALIKYIGDNLKYPKEAADAKTEGKVFVKFIIQKDGSVGNVEVLKGIGYGCDEEAMRVVRAMPKWNPGKQNGEPVNVFFTMPFKFLLDNKEAAKDNSLVGAKNTDQFTVAKVVSELTSPIYYVDGKKVATVEGINPQDIESINVLKGEEATKQYGEAGKSGVILITLKKK